MYLGKKKKKKKQTLTTKIFNATEISQGQIPLNSCSAHLVYVYACVSPILTLTVFLFISSPLLVSPLPSSLFPVTSHPLLSSPVLSCPLLNPLLSSSLLYFPLSSPILYCFFPVSSPLLSPPVYWRRIKASKKWCFISISISM